MKTIELITCGVFFATCTLVSAKEKPTRPPGPPREVPAEVLAKFDKDGDGKLSKEEREAMREERKAKMLEKFDADGDGKLSDAERETMREAMKAKREELLKKYDANANGRLDPEEIKAARDAGEEVPDFGGGPGGPKRGGPGGKPPHGGGKPGGPGGPPPQP